MKIIYIGLRSKKINQYKIGVGNFEQSVVLNISTFCSILVNSEQTTDRIVARVLPGVRV